ncbi:MAG: acetylglutamate kinase [Acidobacteriota bacterium]|nr:acetylglutamate kinase [Acidobacteriota bacterium]
MSKSLSGVDVGPVVLKLGGELIDTSEGLDGIATLIAQAAAQRPVVVIHGGGREIDTELARAGLNKRGVDGLRITDQATLDVVVGVLAGRVNTRLVAAVTRAGTPAVGLTGADDRIGLCRRASPYRALDGSTADLGLVGQPLPTEAPRLLDRLRRAGYTPIVACIGVTQDGQLLNVNADMLAAQLAVNLEVSRLIILGATAGVLDSNGHSLTRLDDADVEQLVASGDITAGMVAKLDACRLASRNGVDSVIIADGRRANDLDLLPGTVITTGGGSTNPQAPALTENTDKKGDGL